MVIQRETHKTIVPKEYTERIKLDKCPVCEKPKKDWNRRKDWRCCCSNCTEEYNKNITWGWGNLRIKVFKRDNFTCKHCGKQPIDKFDTYSVESLKKSYLERIHKRESELIADHIIPIALGGEQWDIDNIQTLCIKCNKIKTRQDATDIGKQRRIERLQAKGQKTL